MKRVFLLSTFLCFFVFQSFCQTYYYKYLYSVDNNGVKSNMKENSKYVTFAKSKSVCYFSNKNGVSLGDDLWSGPFLFDGKNKKGVHIYVHELKYLLDKPQLSAGEYGSLSAWRSMHLTLYFSPDLKRINVKYGGKMYDESPRTHVYEMTTEQEENNEIDMY